MPVDKTDAPIVSSLREGGKTGSPFSVNTESDFRFVLLGLLLAPILLLIGGSYLAYQFYYSTLEYAKAELGQDTAVAEEHAVRVLDTHRLVAARIKDLISGLSDEQISAQERSLHLRMAEQIRDLPAVETAWVEDRAGHPLVTATAYPADRNLDLSGQEYFHALHDSADTGTFIGAVTSRRTNRPLFTVVQRRQDASGVFQGVIVVGVSPDYFRSFYSKLLDNQTDYAAGLYRNDGAPLARYPKVVWRDSRPALRTLLLQGLVHNPNSGIVAGPSGLDRAGKILAYRRVEGYPVYATIARTQASILRQWRDGMIADLYIGAPATVGLVIVSVFAWRRTRREQQALVQAREAMTRREAVEEQLRRAQKMDALGQLTAGVAHDFNNLLTVIAGNLELLGKKVGADHPNLQALAAGAMHGVDRAATLTHRLLAFSRRQPLDPKPVDINHLVAGMHDLLRRTLGEQVTIETILSGGLWTSLVDPNELEHSLLNLAINARDAMPKGGVLIIETANASLDETQAATHAIAAGQYVRVSVVDSGDGMSRAVLEKAFDPFFTTKEAGHGTGLGLSQVYGFTRQSGGCCTIDSKLGEGTNVRLYLPRYLGSVATTIEKRVPATEATGNGEAILVVEDDEDVRAFAVRLLGDLGYNVLAAADGAAALDILDRHPGIRLLFTDCVLPGDMNGREVAEAACRRRPGLKVLYTTGYARDAIVHDGRLDPGIELILKPFTAAALGDKIRQMLGVAPSPGKMPQSTDGDMTSDLRQAGARQ